MTPRRTPSAPAPAPVADEQAEPVAPVVEAPAEPDPEPPTYLQVGPPCKQLRNKGMYVYTDGVTNDHADYDNTIYWCLRSMKSFGPDNDEVHREHCCDPARSCYEAY